MRERPAGGLIARMIPATATATNGSPPPSLAERGARGKAARSRAPRTKQGEWAPAPARRDTVEILEEQASSRVPELVPIRYGRMLVSAFTFYRGAAAIMAGDLAGTPDSGIPVQLCGDAHLSNFGIYSAPDRRLVFDVNDFDETPVGPWEWDLKRLVASLEIAGRDRAFKARQRRAIVQASARQYREAMREFATKGNLEVWYARLDVEDFLEQVKDRFAPKDVGKARASLAKAKTKTSERAIQKLATRVDGDLRFVSDPPLIVRLSELVGDERAADVQHALASLLDEYRRGLAPELRALMSGYRAVDMARKVVGVGSVGTRAWIILLEGRDEDDPLVLQAKEAQTSVLEPYVGASRYANHGERVVQGQRFMQAASDPLLGWQEVTGIDGERRDFYVRQLWDGKGSADIDTMAAEPMQAYARLCGWTLARAHARSGDRVAIASYLGGGDVFDRAMVDFATAYAEQNDLDFRELEQAVEDGRIAATPGL